MKKKNRTAEMAQFQGVSFCILTLLTVILVVFFSSPVFSEAPSEIKELTINEPFKSAMLADQDVFTVDDNEVRIYQLKDGRMLLVGIGVTPLDDGSPDDIQKAWRMCELNAQIAIVQKRDGIQIKSYKETQELEKTAVYVSSFLSVSESKIRGMVKDIPVIGSWKCSGDPKLYVAIGQVKDTSNNLNPLIFSATEQTGNAFLVEGNEPFRSVIMLTPSIRTNEGTKAYLLGDGRKLVVSVGSAVVKKTTLRARKIARMKAMRNLLKSMKNIQICSIDVSKDGETLVINDGIEKTVSISEFLSVSKESVLGILKALPEVACWTSKDGKVCFVALGKMMKENGGH